MAIPASPRSTLLALILLSPSPALAADCGRPAEPIAAIQGSGPHSPMVGERVIVEGIVTFDASQRGGLGGFFLQQTDAAADADPATSDALFVYSNRPSPRTGQRVRVTGTVQEYHDLTELTSVTSVIACGDGALPEPVPLSLPWPEPAAREALEGMRVTVTSPLVVIDHFDLHRYGALTLAPALQPVPTQLLPPGPAAIALHRQQQRQRLLLDDGRRQPFPTPVPYPPGGLSLQHSLRAGTEVTGLTGVLDYRYGEWRLHPDAMPHFHDTNPRQPAPVHPGGNTIRVVTLNLGNFFNGDSGDFSGSRGARNQHQLSRQTQRLVATLTAAEADIAAVAEIENDGYGPASALAELSQALGPEWRYIQRRGHDGDDAIRVALLYRHTRVQPVGAAQSPPAASPLRRGRPPLLQHFQPASGGATVAIVVVHLKSKSCRHARGEQRDQQDGQGCFGQRRLASAEALSQWLATLAHPPGHAGTLITGDLNSYARELPLQQLAQAGYSNLLPAGPNHASSYRFRGRSGTLDYSLADANLRPRVRQTHIWAINADEPRALGYQVGYDAGNDVPAEAHPITEPVPWRSSDHDPVITDLDL
ncbi:ExeM/NucH family extracellular endonuclease [Marinobacter sp. SS21]|uniref:ExeM/NucH family extracellular endonuclease n=1 Tax=Marinobacter sp. SS21 TaxID=2979460 RepID=UPI00232A9F8F|nr:ExeM/NucH family extracellular endonuclease [Marinobacter sp. SS21]MDC0661064.1 ExeM/NucH family extracellular endonuclease [Marinobacter sp. SS21]